MDYNVALCIKEKAHIGYDMMHNFCTGQVTRVDWTGVDWFGFGFMVFCLFIFFGFIGWVLSLD